MSANVRNLRWPPVALALAKGSSIRRAAKDCKVSERQIRRWLAEDAGFRDLIQEQRNTLFGRAVGILTSISGRAARKLGKLIDSGNEKVALAACKTVLEAGIRCRELSDVLREIAELKVVLEVVKRGNK
jgi:Homeodomain-like domain